MRKLKSNHIRFFVDRVSFTKPSSVKGQIEVSKRLIDQLLKELNFSKKIIRPLPHSESKKLFNIGNDILKKVKTFSKTPFREQEEFKPMIEEIEKELDKIKIESIPSDKIDLVKDIYDLVESFPAKVRSYLKKVTIETKEPEKVYSNVPESWKKELLQKREKTDDLSETLKREKAQSIKTEDREIKKPGLFIRYLKKITDYVSGLNDPSKRSLFDDLVDLSQDITPKLRKKQEFLFKKEKQDQLVSKAKKLKDDGTLLMYLGELINEKYPAMIRRASISDLLRETAYLI